MITLLIAAAAFFGGYIMGPTRVVDNVVTVKVPVPVECRETVPDRPVMPLEQLDKAPTLDQYVQASMAEIQRREGYEGELAAALKVCTEPIGP